MGLHAEDTKIHSDESHMSNSYRRNKLGLSTITLCFLKTRTFRGGGENDYTATVSATRCLGLLETFAIVLRSLLVKSVQTFAAIV